MRPEVVLCDVDGTIADMGKGLPGRRGPYDWDRVGEDEPIEPIIKLVRILRLAGYPTVFVSGRKEQCRQQTEMWLDTHVGWSQHGFLEPAPLFMRADNDNRPDNEVKLDIYRQHILPTWRVLYVVDDRDQVVRMWRGLGLTVLQVADGAF